MLNVLRHRSLLSYPGGMQAGFSSAHVGSKGSVRFSGVANGASFRNILTGEYPNTVSGTTFSRFGHLGTTLNIGSSDTVAFSGMPTATPVSVTAAGIFQVSAIGTFRAVIGGNGADNGSSLVLFGCSDLNQVLARIGSSNIYAANFPTMIVDVPYFSAVSYNSTSGIANFVLARLDTGQIYTDSQSAGAGLTLASDGTYLVGQWAGTGLGLTGNIATAMYSENGHLSINELTKWARDPWSFWYTPSSLDVRSYKGQAATGTEITSPQGNLVLSADAPATVATLSVFLYPVDNANNDVILRDPTVLSSAAGINIVSLLGNLVLSSTIPVVVTTNHRDISPAQGNLALSSIAPVALYDRNIISSQGNLILSPTAPAAVRTSNVFVNPLQGNIVLSSTVPTVVRTAHRDIVSPQGNIVLSQTAPSVVRTANVFTNPLQGNIALSSNAPDVQAGAGISKSPPQAELILSPTTPTVVQSEHRNLAIPQGNITLSGTAPVITISVVRLPAQGNLILSPTVPSVVRTAHVFVNALQGNLALSPVAPVVLVNSNRLPLQGNFVLSPTAPTVFQTFHRNITVSQGNAILTAESPTTGGAMSRLPAQANLALSPTVPSVVRTSHRNISPSTKDILLSATAPTFFASNHYSILVSQANLVLSSFPVQLIPGIYIYPIGSNLTLTTSEPVIIKDKLHHWSKIISLQGSISQNNSLSGSISQNNSLSGDVI